MQLSLFPEDIKQDTNPLDVNYWDKVIVAFSGGKDSMACLLYLLEIGFPTDKIEMMHHCIDGREGSQLFDWEITTSYCEAIANAFGIPLYFSWREGGLEREMMRDNQPTAPTWFETPLFLQSAGGKSNKLGTRLKFPQVSGDLRVRWCSSYGKISIGNTAIRNQSRFCGMNVLVVSGERREESKKRSTYNEFEKDAAYSNKINVWRWRPVIDWKESDIWEIYKRFKVNPHVAYKLGWGRVSCLLCIFASNNQLASSFKLFPEKVIRVAQLEEKFSQLHKEKLITEGKPANSLTIHRKLTVMERVKRGVIYSPWDDVDVETALLGVWNQSIFLENWKLPLGAFSTDSAGPS
jgi:3'-phosphoadenosine 5'-phosphosulfate sulfotransferase (PAPS reductase)/FAD synthetase